MSQDISILEQINLTPEGVLGDQTTEPIPEPIDWSVIDEGINPWDYSIPAWIEQFRKRTIQTAFIPLNKQFVDYLLEDGIDIPDDVYNLLPDSSLENISFHTEIIKAIHSGIAKFDGKVFPKLIWSSPKDGAWLSHDRSLQCSFVRDVITLLKGSPSCVAKNLINYPENAAKNGFGDNVPHLSGLNLLSQVSKITNEKGEEVEFPHAIVLRKWSNLYPSREFRVFVAHKRIVAVSQRDMTLYEELQVARERQRIRRAIADNHADHVEEKFNKDHYVYDVYIDTKDRVWIVDFHPYSQTYCQGLLFDWDAHLFPFLKKSESVALPYDELKRASALDNELKSNEADQKGSADTEDRAVANGVEKKQNAVSLGPSMVDDTKQTLQQIMRDSVLNALDEDGSSKRRHFVESYPSVEVDREELRKEWLSKQIKDGLRIEEVPVNEEDNEECGDEEWDDWLFPETSFAMRIVTSETEREGHRLATLQSVMSRLPTDGIDVSDATAIERFIEFAKSQQYSDDSDSDYDSDSDSEADMDGDKDNNTS